MIKFRQMSENCNVLTNNYDLHPNSLINSFMYRKCSGESAQSIAQKSYSNRN